METDGIEREDLTLDQARQLREILEKRFGKKEEPKAVGGSSPS